MSEVNVAVVGVTGMVGQTILEILEERDFPIANLIPLASARSAGEEIEFKNEKYTIQELTETTFDENDIDIAFFAGGGTVSEKFIPIAIEKGVYAIDNSSHFRMDEGVSLVVPEVNAGAIQSDDKLVSNPNCSTIQAMVVLKPLLDEFGIKRVVYNTYQSVSGSGVGGVRDLEEGTTDQYKYSIKKNVLPQIDVFMDNGYTKEEMKMIEETNKILDNDDIRVTATAVRVPVKNSHAISINLELGRDYDIQEVYDVLEKAPGVVVYDNIENEEYPLQEQTDGKDEVYVGRIRRDDSVENGLNLWCTADNIRKGAATNSVQIAEQILESHFN